jgi:predicted amidohydrolase
VGGGNRQSRRRGCHAPLGGSVIGNPDGIIVAETNSDADELIVHSCNLDDCLFGKQSRFDFCRHRRIEQYRLMTEQTGVVKSPESD